jgi:hypothetical protein
MARHDVVDRNRLLEVGRDGGPVRSPPVDVDDQRVVAETRDPDRRITGLDIGH